MSRARIPTKRGWAARRSSTRSHVRPAARSGWVGSPGVRDGVAGASATHSPRAVRPCCPCRWWTAPRRIDTDVFPALRARNPIAAARYVGKRIGRRRLRRRRRARASRSPGVARALRGGGPIRPAANLSPALGPRAPSGARMWAGRDDRPGRWPTFSLVVAGRRTTSTSAGGAMGPALAACRRSRASPGSPRADALERLFDRRIWAHDRRRDRCAISHNRLQPGSRNAWRYFGFCRYT